MSGEADAAKAQSRHIDWQVQPGGRVNGDVSVPGDKSISHRAVMLASLADGQTRIRNFLEGEDCRATLVAFRRMGVDARHESNGDLLITGQGIDGLQVPGDVLDLGNSGTSMRLMCGLLAGQAFDSVVTGDDSLRRRPMRRVTDPLTLMGASFKTTEQGTAPIRIQGGSALSGIEFRSPVASAQIKSAILLAGLYAEGRTTVYESHRSRDHSERMLRHFGYPVADNLSGAAPDGIDADSCFASLQGGGRLTAADLTVPADISSAAFFMVAAAISPGATLRLPGVGVNPTRTGIIDLLRRMGADITLSNETEQGGEPVADITVTGGRLVAAEFTAADVPRAIDEFPVLFVAAACADGSTRLSGAEELRVKESDRIDSMITALKAVGVRCEARPDGAVIEGGAIGGGTVDSLGDHRVAMAMAVAALRAESAISIRDCANVATSFPGFVDRAAAIGLTIKEQSHGE